MADQLWNTSLQKGFEMFSLVFSMKSIPYIQKSSILKPSCTSSKFFWSEVMYGTPKLSYVIVFIMCCGFVIICCGSVIICCGFIIICCGSVIICSGFVILCCGYVIIRFFFMISLLYYDHSSLLRSLFFIMITFLYDNSSLLWWLFFIMMR